MLSVFADWSGSPIFYALGIRKFLALLFFVDDSDTPHTFRFEYPAVSVTLPFFLTCPFDFQNSDSYYTYFQFSSRLIKNPNILRVMRGAPSSRRMFSCGCKYGFSTILYLFKGEIITVWISDKIDLRT